MDKSEEKKIEDYFDDLKQYFSCKHNEIDLYWEDLNKDTEFLDSINRQISKVPEFHGKQFINVSEMRVYRCLLYLVTRILKPSYFVETGVHNGMSSAFILLALKHNNKGQLFSIDLPPTDSRILAQGTNKLPKNRNSGWIIPDYLRKMHELRLESAQLELPKLLGELGKIDLFLHDSDHEYPHLMFELSLAWGYLDESGLAIIDNIEQNDAFLDFTKSVPGKSMTIASFEGEKRTWKHGLILKNYS